MRDTTVRRVALFVMLCGLAAYLGCAAPKPCTVSPVQIEEIASDIRDLDVSLKDRKGVLAKLEAEIAELETSIAARNEEVPVKQTELQRLKKASGRTEKPEPAKTASGSGM